MGLTLSESKEKILNVALGLSSKFGLVNLSIGELAKVVGMSKSGLFGHFKSKEALQKMVLDFAAHHFVNTVIKPALKKERGIPRLEAIVDNWITWSLEVHIGGCPIVTAAIEFDDRPGVLRDHVQFLKTEMIKGFEKTTRIAVIEGHLDNDLDCEQFVFELYSFMIGFHIYGRLMNEEMAKEKFKKSFKGLISRHEAKGWTT
ncbi:TetR/AcrR family transcriptional regulator [Bacteriovoracales bacterium]|nr:TetR/AcrR family transcriptional regulator [Bacteriovoracales bacterium]